MPSTRSARPSEPPGASGIISVDIVCSSLTAPKAMESDGIDVRYLTLRL